MPYESLRLWRNDYRSKYEQKIWQKINFKLVRNRKSKNQPVKATIIYVQFNNSKYKLKLINFSNFFEWLVSLVFFSGGDPANFLAALDAKIRLLLHPSSSDCICSNFELKFSIISFADWTASVAVCAAAITIQISVLNRRSVDPY